MALWFSLLCGQISLATKLRIYSVTTIVNLTPPVIYSICVPCSDASDNLPNRELLITSARDISPHVTPSLCFCPPPRWWRPTGWDICSTLCSLFKHDALCPLQHVTCHALQSLPPFVTPSTRNTGCHKYDVCYDRTLPYLDSQLVTLTQIEIIFKLNILTRSSDYSGVRSILFFVYFPCLFLRNNTYIIMLSWQP